MTSSSMKSKLKNLIRRSDGNFAMLAALVVPVLFMAGSLALDTTNSMSLKVRLQNAADSAALATVTRLSQEESFSHADAKAFAAKFLKGQVEEDMPAFSNMSIEPVITITTESKDGQTLWRVAISLTGKLDATPMSRIWGQDKLYVGVAGTAESGTSETKGSFSMTLVLDQSGSMGWNLGGLRKIDVLKTAVGGLVDQVKKADPTREYVRLGASSYNTTLTGSQNAVWNPEKVRTFVDALPATGGTDSTDAFKWAYDEVNHQQEINQHFKRSGQVPEKYIVFMTDGDNNYSSADSSTKILCDQAKADGVQVYTVAFAAPLRGKQLLSYCATSPDYFFDASNAAELISAFKSIGIKASKIVSRLTQ
jgi:Flp pilus assembly protein TadG